MKKIKLFCGILALMLGFWGEGFCFTQLKALSVDRITYLGPRHEDFGNGTYTDYEQFRYETGTLYCRQGFIANSSYEHATRVGDDHGPDAERVADAAELKAVSGFFIISLDRYVSWTHHSNLKCFPRSAETYSRGGVPYVAVAYRPGASAGPLPYASVGAVVTATTEGGSPAEFLVALNRAYSKPVVLQLVVGGSAKNGQDYQRIRKTVKIAAGNVSATVLIRPKRDRKAEGTETVVISIRPNKKYGIAGGSATVTISDAP